MSDLDSIDNSFDSSNKGFKSNGYEDLINKKLKLNDDSIQINRISRKMSNELIQAFERFPIEQISKLLEVIKDKDSPDLQVKVNIADLMENGEDSGSEEKKRKKRESKEKECKCCKQVVKRHHCTHSYCDKPCLLQEKVKKNKN